MPSNEDVSDREIDEMIEAVCGWFERQGRRSIVALLFVLSAVIFGVGFLKACVFGLALWLLMSISIGRRRFEQIAGLWFFMALVYWLEIPAVEKIINFVSTKIS